jgi:Uma2 family endonuclease
VAIAELTLHRLDAETYGQIVASGALSEERVELIDGLIIDMSPNSPLHAQIVRRLTQHFRFVEGWALSVQLPLEVAADCVPEPDVALVVEPTSAREHPDSARLVVEVAVSSIKLDRGRKAELYAAAGVQEYWIVDVERLAVEVCEAPNGDRYERVRVLRSGDALPAIGGAPALPVDALFDGLTAPAR